MRTKASKIPMSKAKREELEARTYLLRVEPDQVPDVFRTIELPALAPLSELQQAIQAEFRLESDRPYTFYMTEHALESESGYEGPGKGAEQVTLFAAGCKPDKEFLYIHDYLHDSGSERLHRVRVESQAARKPDVYYPRIVAAAGEPPAYPVEPEAPKVEPDLLPLAEEAAEACAKAEADLPTEDACVGCGNPRHHHPVDPATLPPRAELAHRLQAALAGRPEQIVAFEAFCDFQLLDWLSDLFFDLAENGRQDEALSLYDSWAGLLEADAEEFLGSRAMLLFRAGRPEQAKAAIETQLREMPEDFGVQSVAIAIYFESGDLERAEELARRYYEEAQHIADPEEQLIAGQQLAEVLRSRDKLAEAEALEQTLSTIELLDDDADDDEDDEDDDDDDDDELTEAEAGTSPKAPPADPLAGWERFVVAPSEVSRNQDCPCGSGKKYKKCCGAADSQGSSGKAE